MCCRDLPVGARGNSGSISRRHRASARHSLVSPISTVGIFCGRAEMEIVGVPQKWVIPCAWKFPAENFTSDAYHTATAHAFLAKLNQLRAKFLHRCSLQLLDASEQPSAAVISLEESPAGDRRLRADLGDCLQGSRR